MLKDKLSPPHHWRSLTGPGCLCGLNTWPRATGIPSHPIPARDLLKMSLTPHNHWQVDWASGQVSPLKSLFLFGRKNYFHLKGRVAEWKRSSICWLILQMAATAGVGPLWSQEQRDLGTWQTSTAFPGHNPWCQPLTSLWIATILQKSSSTAYQACLTSTKTRNPHERWHIWQPHCTLNLHTRCSPSPVSIYLELGKSSHKLQWSGNWRNIHRTCWCQS